MVGPSELLLVLIVVLIVVIVWRGPQVLPQLGEALGKAIRGVRDNIDDEAGSRPQPPGTRGEPSPDEPQRTSRHDDDDASRPGA